MCSQYEIKCKLKQVAERLTAPYSINIDEVDYSSHIYPFAKAPVIISTNDSFEFSLMNYSLIPYWSDTAKPKFATYNARLDRPTGVNETLKKIYDAPAWRLPFSSRRCLVPLSSFYESCRSGSNNGHIVQFSSFNDDILFAAGIYDQWLNPQTQQVVQSFAIVTDDPTDFILSVGHDRQPVFLAPQNHKLWLNPQQLPAQEAYDFLKSQQQQIDYQVHNIRELKNNSDANQLSLF